VTERLQFKPDRYYDPQTRTVVVDGVPIYQYSFREEFVQEIRGAGFEVTNEDVFKDLRPAHPVLEAFMRVDAVKPAGRLTACHNQGVNAAIGRLG
jgi:hypothetical protein